VCCAHCGAHYPREIAVLARESVGALLPVTVLLQCVAVCCSELQCAARIVERTMQEKVLYLRDRVSVHCRSHISISHVTNINESCRTYE